MNRVKTAEHIVEILSLSDRPIVLVFLSPRVVAADRSEVEGWHYQLLRVG